MPSCSEWPPEVNVFPHFSHFRQGRCQSFPREVTRSATQAQRSPLWDTALGTQDTPRFQPALPKAWPHRRGGPPRVLAGPRVGPTGAPWVVRGTSTSPRPSSQAPVLGGAGGGGRGTRGPVGGAPVRRAWALLPGQGRPSGRRQETYHFLPPLPCVGPGRGAGKRRPGIAPRAPVSASVFT